MSFEVGKSQLSHILCGKIIVHTTGPHSRLLVLLYTKRRHAVNPKRLQEYATRTLFHIPLFPFPVFCLHVFPDIPRRKCLCHTRYAPPLRLHVSAWASGTIRSDNLLSAGERRTAHASQALSVPVHRQLPLQFVEIIDKGFYSEHNLNRFWTHVDPPNQRRVRSKSSV